MSGMMGVGIALAAVVGLVAGWWLGRRSGAGALDARVAVANAEALRLQAEAQERKEETARLRSEKDGLTADRAKWQQSAAGLTERTAKQEDELIFLREEKSALEIAKTQAEAQLQAAQQSLAEERASFMRMKAEMKDSFAALAADSLESANKRFLELATDKFEAKQQAIDTLLQPVKETLVKLDEQTRELEVKREGAYRELGQQLLQLNSDQKNLKDAATALSSALRDTRTTGKWGEIVLRRVVELAGMTEHCDFTQQHTQDDNRPDLIVHLPNGRKIIVDAKTTMSSFHDAAETTDENLRQQKLKEHAKNIRAQAMGLAKRRYEKSFEDAIDLTVCFIPHDVYYYAALQMDPGLFEDAAAEKIVFATPTTLIALLKAGAFGWQQDSLRREAKEILKQAQDVYERLTTATGYFKSLGGCLDGSVESYNNLLGSLEGRVFPAARRMKELGISGNALPAIKPIDKAVRATRAKDWQTIDNAEGIALAAAEEKAEG
jgi:DNA recombination protein RmuC